MSNLPTADIAEVKKKLTVHGGSVVAERLFQVLTKLLYTSGYVSPAAGILLLEIKFKAGANLVKVTVKSPAKDQSEAVRATVERLLKA